MVHRSTRFIIVRRADLFEMFSSIFLSKMCVFVLRPMKLVTFLRKNGDHPKLVVDLFMNKTFRNKNHGTRRGFRRKKVTTTTVNLGNRRGFCVRIQISSFFLFYFF